MKTIGTAPAQSPNVEYDVIDEPVEVFCEDQGKTLPEADCQQIGELYYSKKFLGDLSQSCDDMLEEANGLESLISKFFRGEGVDMKLIDRRIRGINYEMRCIRNMMGRIDISPEGGK